MPASAVTTSSTDPMAVRRAIGVLPHATGLYARLTTRENIAYYGALHGMRGAALSSNESTH